MCLQDSTGDSSSASKSVTNAKTGAAAPKPANSKGDVAKANKDDPPKECRRYTSSKKTESESKNNQIQKSPTKKFSPKSSTAKTGTNAETSAAAPKPANSIGDAAKDGKDDPPKKDASVVINEDVATAVHSTASRKQPSVFMETSKSYTESTRPFVSSEVLSSSGTQVIIPNVNSESGRYVSRNIYYHSLSCIRSLTTLRF